MKKLYGFLIASVAIVGLWAADAKAHVLFVDPQTKIAAVFHSNPDDDPIAGQPSELYFDIQDKNSEVRIPYSGYDLFITDEQGTETSVPIRASDSTAIAEYTFPAQGLYQLALKSQPQYDSFQKVELNGSLRVNRGVGVTAFNDTKGWAITGLIVGLTIFALLAITFVNFRREIFDKSKF